MAHVNASVPPNPGGPLGSEFRAADEQLDTDLVGRGSWFRALVAHSSDVIAVIDTKGRVVYANPAAEEILGYDPIVEIGRDLFELVHPDDVERIAVIFSDLIRQPRVNQSAVFRFRNAAGDWRFLDIYASNSLDDPAISGIVINARDVTDQRNLARALRILSDGNQILVHATRERTLIHDMCQLITQRGGYLLSWIGFARHDQARTISIIGASGSIDYLTGRHFTWADSDLGSDLCGVAIRTKSSQVLPDAPTDESTESWHSSALRPEPRTTCAIPFDIDSNHLGVLSIYAEEPGAFDPEAVSLFQELASGIGYGVSRIRDGRKLKRSLAERQLAVQSAQSLSKRLAEAQRVAHLGSFVRDVERDLVEASDEMCRLLGIESGSTFGGDAIFDFIHPADRVRVREASEARLTAKKTLDLEFRLLLSDSTLRWVRMQAAWSYDEQLGHDVIVGTAIDVTARRLAEESLEYGASHDSLTGLINRAAFLDKVDIALKQANGRAYQLAVLLMDIDDFRTVNDSLGHPLGDQLLTVVARRISARARPQDAISHFSGDEFALLIEPPVSMNTATLFAQRINEVFHTPFKLANSDVNITVSIGVALSDATSTSTELLRHAELAMYLAKRNGKNRFEFSQPQLQEKVIERMVTLGDLHDALERSEFEVFYQPIVRIVGNTLAGAEALIRWNHPRRGLLLPRDFFEIAESSSMAVSIGTWVRRQALHQVAAWRVAGIVDEKFYVSVNISPRQLAEPSVVRDIADDLEQTGVTPGSLMLEITEDSLMSDFDVCAQRLGALKGLGVRLALDDYGTGYSSLSRLASLPVDVIKIDKAFIDNVAAGPEGSAVVQSVIDVSTSLGLETVAEGVEDPQQCAVLKSLGCTYVQGFWFAEPSAPDALAKALQQFECEPSD